MTEPVAVDLAGLVSRLPTYAAGRRIVAVAGAPGSGKSTLAERLVAAVNAADPGVAAILPMDGYQVEDNDLANGRLVKEQSIDPDFVLRDDGDEGR